MDQSAPVSVKIRPSTWTVNMSGNIHRTNGSKKPGKPWEPSALQLEVYERHALGESQQKIADSLGKPRSTIAGWIKKVDDYLRPILMQEIRDQKSRATIGLRRAIERAWEAFDKDPCPGYIGQAIAAQMNLLKIWGADVPPKTQGESEYRYAGKSREQVIRERIDQLQDMLSPSTNESNS